MAADTEPDESDRLASLPPEARAREAMERIGHDRLARMLEPGEGDAISQLEASPLEGEHVNMLIDALAMLEGEGRADPLEASGNVPVSAQRGRVEHDGEPHT